MRVKLKLIVCAFITISTIAITAYIYHKKNFKLEQFNRDMYVYESKHNIEILNAINNNQLYEINYMSAVGLAYNIIDIAQQGNIQEPINFSYMCKDNKWKMFNSLIEKALSVENLKKFSNKDELLYPVIKNRINMGINILEKNCKKISEQI